eukprot:g1917.t1
MYTCTYLYGDQRVFTERSRACAAPVLSSCGGLLVGCYLAACCYLIGTSGTVLLWGGILYGAILYLAVHVFIRHRLHYVSNFVAFGSVSGVVMFFLLGLGSFLQVKFPSFVHGGSLKLYTTTARPQSMVGPVGKWASGKYFVMGLL